MFSFVRVYEKRRCFMTSRSCKGDRLPMLRRYNKIRILKVLIQHGCKNRNDGIFGTEMTGIYKIDVKLLCEKELVILYVGCEIGITAFCVGILNGIAS